MRKNKGLFFVVATLLAVTCLLVSCNSEVSDNAGGGDKLVYATFDNGSKNITPHVTISYDLIDLNQAYWIYTATKNDGGGSTGKGTFAVSSTLEKGLSGTIGPFSVGSWKFEVAGYKTKGTSAPTSTTVEYVEIEVGGTTYYLSEKVFEGTNASVSLTTGTESAPAPIDMTVNLVTDGNGQLVLDKDFKFAWAGTGGETGLKMNVYGAGTLVEPIPLTKSGAYYTFGSEDLVYNVAAGDYNLDVEISYTYNDVKYVVATVSNLAVKVYSGQTTRIDAAILEGNFVYATINASLKSTATTTTVVDTAPTTFVTSYTPASVKSGSVSATEVTTVEFPAEALKATGSTVTEGYSVTSYELDVTVTDIDASQESTFVVEDVSKENVVASIDLTLTMIETSSTEATKSTTVETFENSSVVAVTTYIAKNLTDPVVYYNGTAFTAATTGAAGTYNYEGTSGKLVIYTNHFSEFYVSSKDEAYNATTGTAFAKVMGAVDAAVANQTIKLLKNCTSTEEALEFNDDGVVFDLNGKTLTVVRTGSTKSIQVTSDVTIKNGAIVGNLSSTTTSSNAAVYVLANGDLTIEDVDITVNSNVNNESHYAVAIFASGAKLAVKDGEFNGLVGTNGQYRNDTLSISGGTFNEAVYFPAHGTYTISGGTFNKAVEIKSGSLTVSGGKFNYADDPQVYTPYWNGTTVTGCSLAAVAYNGVMTGTDYGPSPSVTITGGTFAGKIGLARASYAYSYPTLTGSDNVVYLGEDAFDGTGTEEDPFIIDGIDAWMRLVALTENDSTFKATSGKYFKMTDDVDVSSKNVRATVHYFAGHIDFDNHTLSGFNDYNMVESDVGDDGIVAAFSTVNGDVSFSNLKYEINSIRTNSTKCPVVYNQLVGCILPYANGVNICFKNITISGVATGVSGNNHSPLFAYAYENTDLSITCVDCINNATIIGSGFKSAFIGSLIYQLSGNLTFTNCVNNGTIISTDGSPVALLISNGQGNYATGNIAINVSHCVNDGVISSSNPGDGGLLLGSSGTPSKTNYITINGNNWTGYTSNMTLNGELVGSVSNITPSAINISDGKFVLPASENAKYYQLHFSFVASSHAGGNVGYLVEFGNKDNAFTGSLPGTISVSSWVDDKTKTGNVTTYTIENSTSGVLYKDSEGHYVFNEEGSRLRGKVNVSFIAYGSENQVLSISTYKYN